MIRKEFREVLSNSHREWVFEDDIFEKFTDLEISSKLKLTRLCNDRSPVFVFVASSSNYEDSYSLLKLTGGSAIVLDEDQEHVTGIYSSIALSEDGSKLTMPVTEEEVSFFRHLHDIDTI